MILKNALERTHGKLRKVQDCSRILRESLNAPAVSVRTTDEFCGARMVGEAELFLIPVQPLAGKAVSDGADEHRFCKRATVAEVGAGLLSGQGSRPPSRGSGFEVRCCSGT